MKGCEIVNFCKEKWYRPFFASTIFFVCVFVIFSAIFVISEGDPVPDDEYFHFRFAHLLGTEGFGVAQNFDWIYLSKSAEIGAQYPISLYQVFLIPFSFIADQIMGLHIAIAFYIGMVFAIIYYVMRKENVRYPLFFAVLAMTSSYVLARMLLGRAFVLIPSLILLEMYLVIHKKYIPLFSVIIIHILWHQATYFLPIIIVGIVETARYLAEQRCVIRNFFVVCAGTVFGMMFFPGFPKSLIGWLCGILAMQKNDSNAASGTLGGAEMASKDFMSYFVDQELVFGMLVFCVSIAMFLYVSQKKEVIYKSLSNERRIWVYTLCIFLLCITYGSTMLSGRFYDFVFFALVMACAVGVTIIYELRVFTIERHVALWLRGTMIVGITFLFLSALIYVYARSNEFDYAPAEQSAQWIENHSDGREKVYVHNWGNFNLLFFGNTKNVYSAGIEPTTLKNYDPVLYWKYYNIFAHNYYCEQLRDCGDVVDRVMTQLEGKDQAVKDAFFYKNSEAIVHSIRNDFDARFIVSDSEEFNAVLFASPHLIDTWQTFESKKFNGKHMRFIVYKLK